MNGQNSPGMMMNAASPGDTATGVLRRFLPLALLLAGLGLFFALGLDQYLTLASLQAHRETLADYVMAHQAAASALFVLAYAVVVALSIPGGAVLTIAGGFLFGIVWGSALVVAGATAGAVAVFLAARTALGDSLRRRAGPWVQRLESGFRDHAVSYMLTLRLIPVVPFWLVNLVPAFFGVSLGAYALTTVLGIIPGTLVYASVGSGLGATLDAGRQPDPGLIFEPAIFLPLLGLGVLALLPVAYKRLRARAERPSPTGNGA